MTSLVPPDSPDSLIWFSSYGWGQRNQNQQRRSQASCFILFKYPCQSTQSSLSQSHLNASLHSPKRISKNLKTTRRQQQQQQNSSYSAKVLISQGSATRRTTWEQNKGRRRGETAKEDTHKLQANKDRSVTWNRAEKIALYFNEALKHL